MAHTPVRRGQQGGLQELPRAQRKLCPVLVAVLASVGRGWQEYWGAAWGAGGWNPGSQPGRRRAWGSLGFPVTMYTEVG